MSMHLKDKIEPENSGKMGPELLWIKQHQTYCREIEMKTENEDQISLYIES